ncbi:MAG TPA: type IV secretory system conjugative DNA transfer family protein [Longimicrobium sp.]|jgi:type IV secretion system protein VirD4
MSVSPDTLRFRKTRQGAPVHPYTVAALVAASALAGFAAATQYAADRLGYHPNLGPALYPRDAYPPALCVALGLAALLIGAACWRVPHARHAAPLLGLVALAAFAAARGPFYPPSRVVQWRVAFHGATAHDAAQWAPLQAIFDGAVPVGMAAFLAALCTGGYLCLGGSVKHASNAHGTAAFGTGKELLLSPEEGLRWEKRQRAGKKGMPGVMIGRLPPSTASSWPRRSRPGHLLWYRGPSHILTMAPTRSGKGVGAVVPSLLWYPGSVVCMDIKGENFHVTHKQRLFAGGEVYVLDPFRVTGYEHALHAYANPLDTIDTHGSRKDRALDDCKTLAEMLVEEDGKENRHFSDEGRSLLACFMLYVCDEFNGRREERTLMKVRELLTLPAEEFNKLLKQMGNSDNELVRRGVARLQQKEERERTGVISTAQRGIDFLDSIPMANVLVPPPGSDLEAENPEKRPRQVDLSLIKGDVPMTIYLVIPPEALKTHAAWVRMMIACINNMITRIPGRPTHRILMLLDEFAQLGHIRPVVEGISLVGGYGVLFWVIIQDLAQLKGLYRDNWETIFANCDVKQCFGTNDWTTADLLSRMTGETTLFTEGGSSGKGRSYGKSSGHSTNYGESVSEKGRRLLMADEVLRLPPSKQLLFVKGSSPLLVDKINYLTDPEFRGADGKPLFKQNPMYA